MRKGILRIRYNPLILYYYSLLKLHLNGVPFSEHPYCVGEGPYTQTPMLKHHYFEMTRDDATKWACFWEWIVLQEGFLM